MHKQCHCIAMLLTASNLIKKIGNKSQPISVFWVDTDVFHFSLPVTNDNTDIFA